jgi:hypothetical protein
MIRTSPSFCLLHPSRHPKPTRQGRQPDRQMHHSSSSRQRTCACGYITCLHSANCSRLQRCFLCLLHCCRNTNPTRQGRQPGLQTHHSSSSRQRACACGYIGCLQSANCPPLQDCCFVCCSVAGTPNQPGRVDSLAYRRITAVAAGREHALVATSEGQVLSFGGSRAVLGRNGDNSLPGFVAGVLAGKHVKHVAAGEVGGWLLAILWANVCMSSAFGVCTPGYSIVSYAPSVQVWGWAGSGQRGGQWPAWVWCGGTGRQACTACGSRRGGWGRC